MFSLSNLLFLSLASAAPWQGPGDSGVRAIYTLSNDPAGNNILSLALSQSNGTVSLPVLTSTGGKGLLGLNVGPPFGAPGSPAGPDALFSQGSVHVDQNYLFTVNSGSNTLSMFLISPWDPTHPKLVGEPADTLGDFPISVTYSAHLQTACVVNGGAKNGIACFSVSYGRGLISIGGLRPLKDLHANTPPTGPPDTVSDIQFNPSSTALFVTIKGNPDPPAIPGFIYAFAVDAKGQISSTPIISSPSKLILDFSIDFLGSDASAVITDPSFGASIVNIASGLEVTETHHVTIPNQGAACWAAYSPRYNAIYVMDAGNPNITLLDPVSGDIKGAIQYEADAMGGFDTVIDRQWLYVLTGDSSVVVIDLEANRGKQEQHYSLVAQGPAKHWQGMAAYPASNGERGW